jgi:hypothetical protein
MNNGIPFYIYRTSFLEKILILQDERIKFVDSQYEGEMALEFIRARQIILPRQIIQKVQHAIFPIYS